jgi:hypothetical protein
VSSAAWMCVLGTPHDRFDRGCVKNSQGTPASQAADADLLCWFVYTVWTPLKEITTARWSLQSI